MKVQKTRCFVCIAFAAVLVLLVAAIFWVSEATKTRTIAAVDLAENKKLRVVQTFGGEPFDTKVYLDNKGVYSGDGRWGFFYYNHEDGYWNDAETRIAGEVVSVMRNGRWTIRFNTSDGTCEVRRADGWHKIADEPAYFTDVLPGLRVPIGI